MKGDGVVAEFISEARVFLEEDYSRGKAIYMVG
jgi:hypothetical protein